MDVLLASEAARTTEVFWDVASGRRLFCSRNLEFIGWSWVTRILLSEYNKSEIRYFSTIFHAFVTIQE